MRSISTLSFVLVAVLALALPALAGPRVAVVTDSRGFVHGVVKPPGGDSVVATTLRSIVENDLDGSVTHVPDAATLDLGQADVVVLYTTGDIPLDVAALRAFVDNGGGLVGIHPATDTLKNDAGYVNLIGGRFDGHPWNAGDDVVLRAIDPAHPLAVPIGETRLLKEEIYQFQGFDPATVRTVLALDTAATEKKAAAVVPVAWLKVVGEGRVVYTSLGHREDVWTAAWYRQHLAAAIGIAAGAVEADATPNPEWAAQPLPDLAAPDAEAVVPEGRVPGVRLQVYEVGRPMDQLLAVAEGQTPNAELVLPTFEVVSENFGDGVSGPVRTTASATLGLDRDQRLGLRVTTDGFAAVYVDDRLLGYTDGEPGDDGLRAIDLGQHFVAGDHALRVEHFHNRGGGTLRLERGAGRGWQPLGGDLLSVDGTITPVVSPGEKRLAVDAALFRPGDTVPLDGVHPAFALAQVRPDGFEPQVGGMTFLPDGRLAVATFAPLNDGVMKNQPNGTLWALRGVDAVTPTSGRDGVRVEKIADGLWDPIGLVVTDNRLFVCESEQITELLDSDGDGYYEGRRRAAGGWTVDNYHQFTFGPAVDPSDPLVVYVGLSVAMYLPSVVDADGNAVRPIGPTRHGMVGPDTLGRGAIARCDLRTGAVEYIAGGVRTPNGLVFGPGGELFVTENQGNYMPASKLNQIVPGGFYGYQADTQPWTHVPEGGPPTLFSDRAFVPPALWLPQGEVANSPTEPIVIPDLPAFGPYAGQMLVGELTLGGLRRATLEEVDGMYQGAIFRFSQGFEGGVNRLEFAADGSLYVGMTGYRRSWTWKGTTFGLQKLCPTGEIAYEMLDVSARPDGFVVTFTKPADAEFLANPQNYDLSAWTYKTAPNYGGPKIGERRLAVASAEPASDGRSVRLRLAEPLRAGDVVYFRLDPPSRDGERMWSTEAWYTLNRVPSQDR